MSSPPSPPRRALGLVLGSAGAVIAVAAVVGVMVGLRTNSDTWAVLAVMAVGLAAVGIGFAVLVASGNAHLVKEIYSGKRPRR